MTITPDGQAVQDADGQVYHPKAGESVEALLARLEEKDALMRAPLRGNREGLLHPNQLPGCYD
jgi:hypothetical protein